MTPNQLLTTGIRHLVAKDMIGFIGLFADDAVMEFPFAPAGQPRRVEGRAAVHDYLIGYPDLLDVRDIRIDAVHETTDPAVIIAEFTASGAVVANGREYEACYIVVLTARDGAIRHWRDYWDPTMSADLPGGGLVTPDGGTRNGDSGHIGALITQDVRTGTHDGEAR